VTEWLKWATYHRQWATPFLADRTNGRT